MMEVCYGAIVVDNSKVLMVKQRSGVWGFPKGHIEGNETHIETAIREVFEEASINIDIISNKEYKVNYVNNYNINKTVIYYLAKIKDSNYIHEDNEIESVSWVDIDNVSEYLTYENIIKLWNTIKCDIK